MKKIFLSIMCIAGVACGLIQVQAAEQPPVPKGPIKLEFTKNEKKSVMFDHADHADISCTSCHHPVQRDGGKVSFKKCSSSGCHDIPGRKDPMAYYNIIHSRKAGSNGVETCMSCHLKVAGTDKDKRKKLTGCVGSSCHAA
ncbi:MAG: cytochrome c3 family protein [Desulfovibrionaceae bacterium]